MKKHPFALHFGSPLTCFYVTLAAVVCWCLALPPHWMTNDDIAMSMVAHGYGIASTASPEIFFSNVVWGWIVHLTPNLGGIPGYSWAMLASATIGLWGILFSLSRLTGNFLMPFSAVAILLAVTLAFPQFTIVAGMLALCAVSLFALYKEEGCKKYLALACLTGFLSFIIRQEEFLIILVIALPVLPWSMLRRKPVQMACLAMVCAIAGAVAINHRTYQAGEWSAFNRLNHPRALFTDYGLGKLLREEDLQRHGFSRNDILLVSNWFFSDTRIADPDRLVQLAEEAHPNAMPTKRLENIGNALELAFNPRLGVLFVASLLVMLALPNRRAFAAWSIGVGVLILLSLLERQNLDRVYIPILAEMIILPLLMSKPWRRWQGLAVTAILLAGLSGFLQVSLPDMIFMKNTSDPYRQKFSDMPDNGMLVWKEGIPFRLLYPVLAPPLPQRFDSLGTLTLAPYSVATQNAKSGRDPLTLLLSPTGLNLFAEKRDEDLLRTYCKEHHDTPLRILESRQFRDVTMHRVSCHRGVSE